MLVARKSFVARDGSRFIAGRSRIAESHEFARLHPERFEPVPGTGLIPRERTLDIPPAQATSIRPAPTLSESSRRGMEPWRILANSLRCRVVAERRSSTRVRLSRDAHAQLSEFVRQTDADGFETGGLLFGPAPGDGLIEILGASGPGPNCSRGPDFYGPDAEHDRALIDQAERAGLACVGEFHSHPNRMRTPSPQDLTAFSGRRTVDAYVGVLAVRAEDAWEFQPWIVSNGFSRDVCEPAVTIR